MKRDTNDLIVILVGCLVSNIVGNRGERIWSRDQGGLNHFEWCDNLEKICLAQFETNPGWTIYN